MKLIILAAGKGERLMPLTRNTPKPLLSLGNGLTLLETQLNSVEKIPDIDEVILVVGYLSEQIDAKIKFYQKNGLRVTTVFNPFFETSNNLVSLWIALHNINDDFLVTNGDNLFVHEVFEKICSVEGEGIHLTTTTNEDFVEDDMKVIIKDALIKEVNKEIDIKKANAESVGLVRVKGAQHRAIFKEAVIELLRDPYYLKRYWLEVFNNLARKGIPVHPVAIGRGQWQEVDFHMDVSLAEKFLSLKIKEEK